MAAKYDPDAEAEVISWFKQLFDVDLQAGMREMENQLRDGQLLVRYQPITSSITISSSSVSTLAACLSIVTQFSRLHVGTVTGS